MAPIAEWPFRRVAGLAASWMLLAWLGFWPLWYAVEEWLARRRAFRGPMALELLDYESVIGLGDLILFAIVLLVPPLALLAIWREGRASASVHLTIR